MRKILKQQDGTEIVFEGTVEELIELENRLKKESGQQSPAPGRRILNEGEQVATDSVETCPCKTCKMFNETMKSWKKMPQLTFDPCLPYKFGTIPDLPWIDDSTIFPMISPIVPWITITTMTDKIHRYGGRGFTSSGVRYRGAILA